MDGLDVIPNYSARIVNVSIGRWACAKVIEWIVPQGYNRITFKTLLDLMVQYFVQ